tara:strand:- start:691 stop:966 length:276 start_codon:yes stop_codon:yes gene_type:complete
MKFMKNMLSSDGKVSSKRFVTFICLLFMLIGYTANLFWDYDVKDSLFEALQWIVMVGLGFTASENFATKKQGDHHSNTTITHEYEYGDEDD